MPVPRLGLTGPIEDRSVPVTMFCSCDYRRIVGRSIAEVERQFAEHVDEARDPAEHELVPF